MITQLKWQTLKRGIRSYFPKFGVSRAHNEAAARSGRYCYSVWFRHLVTTSATIPELKWDSVAELGPGGSIGVGLSALLSGANSYYGLDVLPHVNVETNLKVFDEIVELFNQQAPIPGEEEFPQCSPLLASYDFPHNIITENILSKSLRPERIDAIRQAIKGVNKANTGVRITYAAPWADESIIEPESIDFALSQAVLEHVDDIDGTYESLRTWLRPGGVMSNQIDYKCHGSTYEWNGHWAVPEYLWKVARGKHSYMINRLPHSQHIAAIEKAGFSILLAERRQGVSSISRQCLSPRFANMPDEDIITTGALIQAFRV